MRSVHSWSWRDALLLGVVLAIATVILSNELGTASLLGDESIYAAVSREAVESGSPLPLRRPVGGKDPNVYLGKPPLKILATAVVFRFFGTSEVSVRILDVLLSLCTIALAFLLGRFVVSRLVGVMAALLLLSAHSWVFDHGARDGVMTALVCLLATCQWGAWIRAVGEPSERRPLWVAVGCGVLLELTKSYLGILFGAALCLTAWAAPPSTWGRWRSLRMAARLPLAATVAFLAWGGYQSVVTRGSFLSYTFYRNLITRTTAGVDPYHVQGPLYFFERLLTDFGPWLLLLVPALALRHQLDPAAKRAQAVLLLWTTALLLVFSLSTSKNPWYIYPLYPGLALLMAGGWQVLSRSIRRPWKFVAAGIVIVGLADGVLQAFEDSERDTRVLDLHRFVRAYERLPDAALLVDYSSIRAAGSFREWNQWYLDGATDVRWLNDEADTPIVAAACLFLVTGDPDSNSIGVDRSWRTLMKVQEVDAREAEIWVLGTCPLDLVESSSLGAAPDRHARVEEVTR